MDENFTEEEIRYINEPFTEKDLNYIKRIDKKNNKKTCKSQLKT